MTPSNFNKLASLSSSQISLPSRLPVGVGNDVVDRGSMVNSNSVVSFVRKLPIWEIL